MRNNAAFRIHRTSFPNEEWGRRKEGSGAGMDPKPAGFRPIGAGGGGGSIFRPAGLRVREPEIGRDGVGFEISPAGAHQGPKTRKHSPLLSPSALPTSLPAWAETGPATRPKNATHLSLPLLLFRIKFQGPYRVQGPVGFGSGSRSGFLLMFRGRGPRILHPTPTQPVAIFRTTRDTFTSS